ncbi:hypothetical protein [Ureibacillus acetophenoni]|uniref:Uncharacterized protein n=1 Tax=Ureibacillus acetophenoni TaxID=614649 RepID=A0A285U3D0_9BACL|nr:hypothetical protein [Ureibacillus acetophenoni]SOC35006.1 hypothetical protein SAMN05877842_101206 [Ureibacillus acetophenoni]
MSEMNAVLQAVLELSKKMDSLESRMSSLEDRMSSLEDRMSSLEDRVGLLEERIGSLEERVGSLEERSGSLEVRVGSLEEQSNKNQQILIEKLDSINEQMMILAHNSVTSKGDIRLLKKKIGMLDY